MYSWLSQVHQATPPTRFKVNDIQAKNSKGNKAFQTPLSEPVLGEVPRSGVEKGKESGGRCSRMCSKLKRRNGSRKRKSSWNSRKGGRVWYECGTAGRLLHRGINTGRLQRPSLETKGKRERARMEGKCVCNDIGVQRGGEDGGGIEKKTRSGTSTLCSVRLQVIELSRADRELRRPINRRMETRCGSGDQISNRGRRTIVSRLNKYSIGYNLWTLEKASRCFINLRV